MISAHIVGTVPCGQISIVWLVKPFYVGCSVCRLCRHCGKKPFLLQLMFMGEKVWRVLRHSFPSAPPNTMGWEWGRAYTRVSARKLSSMMLLLPYKYRSVQLPYYSIYCHCQSVASPLPPPPSPLPPPPPHSPPPQENERLYQDLAVSQKEMKSVRTRLHQENQRLTAELMNTR